MYIKEKVCSYESLYAAMEKCKKGVAWKNSVQAFTLHPIHRLETLRDQLLGDTYEISGYTKFIVYEPKQRDILATKFRDRVFQRSFCDNYLYDELTKSFIQDNAACQRGGGTEYSRKRMDNHLMEFYRENGSNDGYVLKIDIKDYFGSTSHDVAKNAVEKRVVNKWARDKVFQVIDNFPGKIGLGLGSELIQLIQLSVLDDLDHYIKEVLHVKHYVRYMDDMVLIHQDKNFLIECLQIIDAKLRELNLLMSFKKTYIQKLHVGFKYLGFRYKLTETGGVIPVVLKNKFKNEKHHLKGIVECVKDGRMTRDEADDCFLSYLSYLQSSENHAKRCNGTNIQRITNYYNSLWI